MNDIFGFIGTGNMGGALARAAAKSGLDIRILLANRSREKAEKLAGWAQGSVGRALEIEADNAYPALREKVLSSLAELSLGKANVAKAVKHFCVGRSLIITWPIFLYFCIRERSMVNCLQTQFA